jgi:hypothetical protein
MTRASGSFSVLSVLALGVVLYLRPDGNGRGVAGEPPASESAAPAKIDPALTGSAITAVLNANGGKPPSTGKELWDALGKTGKFAQLPVVFSLVRLDSGINNPRVVIAPAVNGLSSAAVTGMNLDGRLFLAANMEPVRSGHDTWVTSVEFISWNTLRRKFDFGVIENMGTDEPRLRVVDGGRCFSCHKNQGPILGDTPWSNTTMRSVLRTLVAERFGLVEGLVPVEPGRGARARIDGMALGLPEGHMVDAVVRAGANLALKRDTFRLMTRYPLGRRAFEAMLVAVVQPGPLDPNDRASKAALEEWGRVPSYLRFAADWVALGKTTNTGVLIDYAPPAVREIIAGVGSAGVVSAGVGGGGGGGGAGWAHSAPKPVGTPPPGGFRTSADATAFERTLNEAILSNTIAATFRAETLAAIVTYDLARADGKHGTPSSAQPSNPKAFVPPEAKAPQKPIDLVNPFMLASTLGLSVGDRKYMAAALTDAVRRIGRQKVTTATLAKEVFAGPEFADVMAGGPLPDRDEFKDRFVAGLNAVLTTRYDLTDGFTPDRGEYASGPRFDPKALAEIKAAVVPTSACLRCHDVRSGAKTRLFEPIPALHFDPLDKQARADWAKTADPKRKQEVLVRLQQRLFADADMPPADAPEYKLFRTEQAALFDDLKRFLDAEIDKRKLDKPKPGTAKKP